MTDTVVYDARPLNRLVLGVVWLIVQKPVRA